MAGKFKIMKKQITNFFKTAKAVAAEAEVKTLKSDLAAANKKISNSSAIRIKTKQQVARRAHAKVNIGVSYFIFTFAI